jgi:hypothetical protein
MDAIEQQAKALLAALGEAERRCLFYEPKDPARDPAYHRAGHEYGDALRALDDWAAEFLRPALEAELRAEAEERFT